ncbi:MAG TPA: SigB/SigF/SigG family RNA polymerase sigma factor [Candidatus Eremiobacteraceae bacterium]|nr:SigB/SigF/SigG family RNA polymerase sigma factor [Candidatus Eremiobacteraceae bacterium]
MSAEPRAPNADRQTVRFDKQRVRSLFASFAASRDPQVREQLVIEHLNLVRYLASRFANRGEPLDDLIQVGMLGLIKAIDRFEPERGLEFTTYATPTVIGEIKRHFRDKGWAIRVPRRLQELNAAVNRAVDTMSVELGRPPTIAELAAALGAGEEEVIEAHELGQAYAPLSLDVDLAGEGEGKSATLRDYLGAADPAMQLAEDRDLLERAFARLDRRERVILYLRFYENASQSDIARRLQVSQMHVSRLQQRALAKMKGLAQEESRPDHAN